MEDAEKATRYPAKEASGWLSLSVTGQVTEPFALECVRGSRARVSE